MISLKVIDDHTFLELFHEDQGLPVPVAVISAGILEGLYKNYTQNYTQNDTEKKYCWLRAGFGSAAIWTFIVPMMIIIMINTVILGMTIWSMVKGRKKGGAEHDVRKKELAKTAVKGLVILLPLMGVTWVIGLFAVEENTTVFAWLFTIFNSLQGVFIFMLHVAKNEALREKLHSRLRSQETRTTGAACVMTSDSKATVRTSSDKHGSGLTLDDKDSVSMKSMQ